MSNNISIPPKQFFAFIDLLGFSSKIITEWDDGEVLDNILSIKKKAIEEHQKDVYKMQFVNGDEIIKTEIQSCTVNTFSDSFVVAYNPRLSMGAFDKYLGLKTIFEIIKIIWKESIWRGFTIRGGITYDSVILNGGDIIGPALIRAYRLENEVAKTSRVVLDNNLILEISGIIKDRPETELELSNMFIRDIDGQVIFNHTLLPSSLEEENKIKNKIEAMISNCKGSSQEFKYYNLKNQIGLKLPQDNSSEHLKK